MSFEFLRELARIAASFSLYRLLRFRRSGIEVLVPDQSKPFAESFDLFRPNKELVFLRLLYGNKSVRCDDTSLQVGQRTDNLL